MLSPGLASLAGRCRVRPLQVFVRLQSALDEVIDLLALGAGKAEVADGGHKLAPLDQRETLSMLPGDSIHPRCAAPACRRFRIILCRKHPPLSGLSLALDNAVGAKKPARLEAIGTKLRA